MIAMSVKAPTPPPALEACRIATRSPAPTLRIAAPAGLRDAASPRRRHSIHPPSKSDCRRIAQAAKPARSGNDRPPRRATDARGLERPAGRCRAGYRAELMTSTDRIVSTADLAPAFSRPCLALRHLWYAGVPGTSPHSSHDWTSGPGPAAQADKSQRHPKNAAPRIDASLLPPGQQCHRCSRRWQAVCFAFGGVGPAPPGRRGLFGRFLQSVVDGGRQFLAVSRHREQMTADAEIRRLLRLPPIVNRHAAQYPSVFRLHFLKARRLYSWPDPSRQKFLTCYAGDRTDNPKYYG